MRSNPETGPVGHGNLVDRHARALRQRAKLERWARRSSEWWVGRGAAVAVAVCWLAIVAIVLLGWLSWDAAAFLAAGAFTFAVAVVMAFDAAVDWFDPQEEVPLRNRLQPTGALWSWLERAPSWLKVMGIPVCFIAGCVVGHVLWH